MTRRLSALTATLLAAIACDTSERPAEPTYATESTAEVLHMFSSELAETPLEQARAELARDAWRREHRFRDAIEPGHLFASTRVSQAELEGGAFAPDEIFQLGAQLFHHAFRREEGFGGADLPPVSRFHLGKRGGPDAERCASCHWRGGIAGAGDGADNAYFDGDGFRQSTTLPRNPPSLAGAGYLEILAREITTSLQRQRADAIQRAKQDMSTERIELIAKGVSYGFLTVTAKGSVDTSELDGIDDDLVIKPFGQKGSFATIREAVEDALNIHHGMQSTYLVQNESAARMGPFGGSDPDGDGVINEVTEGQVSALSLFIAMQEVPQLQPTPHPFISNQSWAEGEALFFTVGCASCHTPSMPLDSSVFELASRNGGAAIRLTLADEGAEPRLQPTFGTNELRLFVFSDLKRHDVGSALADPRPVDGVDAEQFLTRPLWGVARTRPYLHDGRAATMQEAILLHDGDAKASRDAYEALSFDDKSSLRIFLTQFVRQPRLTAFQ